MLIEEGKFYRTRDGRKVGPMVAGSYFGGRTFYGNVNGIPGCTYWANGREFMDRETGMGLVAEWEGDFVKPVTTIHAPNEDYVPLARVLTDALAQASTGKGKARHANGRPFDRQPIMEIGRMVGIGYPTGQAQKKTQEAVGMLSRGEHEAAVAELLGAINYLAAGVILIREAEEKQNPGP